MNDYIVVFRNDEGNWIYRISGPFLTFELAKEYGEKFRGKEEMVTIHILHKPREN